MNEPLERADPLSAEPLQPVDTTLPLAARRWPELVQFFGGYLHQDFDLEGTAEQCIERAIRERDAASRRAILTALRKFRVAHPSEDELASAFLGLGMEYAPPADGLTYRGWLDSVIARAEVFTDEIPD